MIIIIIITTHFSATGLFLCLLKSSSFLMFSVCIERDQWHETVSQSILKILNHQFVMLLTFNKFNNCVCHDYVKITLKAQISCFYS